MKTMVWLTTNFMAFHYWKGAPTGSAFLAAKHRHIFYVKISWLVTGSDREIEFIQKKNSVNKWIKRALEGKTFPYSCEQIAATILKRFHASFVEVSEDGENGATCYEE